MALFDKLKDIAGQAKDAAKNVAGATKDIAISVAKDLGERGNSIEEQAKKSAQIAAGPFSDPVVKQYYEIVCGMYETLMPKTRLDDSNFIEDSKVKKYVEHFMGEACDEEKLNKTLELYRLCWSGYEKNQRNKTYLESQRIRSETMDAGLYQLNVYVAHRVIYPEEIIAAAADYEKVLEVVKDSVNYKHFARGMAKMPYNNHIKQIVVADSFCTGHPITKALVLACVFNSLIKKKNFDDYLMLHYDAVQLALRALHFENQSGDRETYTALSDADYRNGLMQISAFQEGIKDHPFDKEEYIEKIAAGIKSGDVFGGIMKGFSLGEVLGLGYDDFFIDPVDDYYNDAVCNFVWHVIDNCQEWKVNGEVVNQSADPDIMANIVLAYVEKIAQAAGED